MTSLLQAFTKASGLHLAPQKIVVTVGIEHVTLSNDLKVEEGKPKSLYVVFLRGKKVAQSSEIKLPSSTDSTFASGSTLVINQSLELTATVYKSFSGKYIPKKGSVYVVLLEGDAISGYKFKLSNIVGGKVLVAGVIGGKVLVEIPVKIDSLMQTENLVTVLDGVFGPGNSSLGAIRGTLAAKALDQGGADVNSDAMETMSELSDISTLSNLQQFTITPTNSPIRPFSRQISVVTEPNESALTKDRVTLHDLHATEPLISNKSSLIHHSLDQPEEMPNLFNTKSSTEGPLARFLNQNVEEEIEKVNATHKIEVNKLNSEIEAIAKVNANYIAEVKKLNSEIERREKVWQTLNDRIGTLEKEKQLLNEENKKNNLEKQNYEETIKSLKETEILNSTASYKVMDDLNKTIEELSAELNKIKKVDAADVNRPNSLNMAKLEEEISKMQCEMMEWKKRHDEVLQTKKRHEDDLKIKELALKKVEFELSRKNDEVKLITLKTQSGQRRGSTIGNITGGVVTAGSLDDDKLFVWKRGKSSQISRLRSIVIFIIAVSLLMSRIPYVSKESTILQATSSVHGVINVDLSDSLSLEPITTDYDPLKRFVVTISS